MRDTHSCLLGHFGRLALEWGQSEQSRRKATALGVLATVSAGYVSGGAHSPWYKVCLSSHERTVTGEDLLFSAFFPRHPNFSLPWDWWLSSMAEPVGKLKGCWLTSRIHSATILCIAHGLPALRLFQWEHTSETRFWFHTGLLFRSLKGTVQTSACLKPFIEISGKVFTASEGLSGWLADPRVSGQAE